MRLKYQILDRENQAILTLKEVKNFLRLSHDYDDLLVKDLIQASIDYAENFTGKFIDIRKVQCSVFQASNKIHIKYVPFNKVLSAEKKLQSGYEDIGDSIGEINKDESLLEINPLYIDSDIIIKFICGYGKNTPKAIKTGILKHVSSMYELNENALDPVEEIRNLYLPYRSFKI